MDVSRREFIESSASGFALVIGWSQLGCHAAASDDPGASVAPNQWLRIGQDGRVVVTNDKSEMGQGAATVIPLIVAEELGASWDAVTVEHARPGPGFDDMGTAGSSSVASRWGPLRVAAAEAREMLIAAAAARWKVPAGECYAEGGLVRHRGSRRRSPFGDLVAAAAELPRPEAAALKPVESFTLVGTPVPRLDARAVVTGKNQYGIDIRVPRMLRAVVARCPAVGGKVAGWSAERARRVPGVRSVVPVSTGIAVVADSTWAALEGRKALQVEWDEVGGRGIDSAALWGRLAGGFDTAEVQARREGDPRGGRSRAARTLEAEYRYAFQAHAAVEPLNAIADVRSDQCEIWVGTQNANRAQREVAELLGQNPERVTVNVLPLGGAFGRRIGADFVLEAVEVSRAVGAPVQLVWSREDDFAHDMYQSAAIVRMSAALDRAGRVVVWTHRVADFHLTMFGEFDRAGFKPDLENEPWGGFDTPYAFPALDVRIARLPSPVRTGAWRSVFYPSSVTARECFLDEIAVATGADPLALRLGLLEPPAPITRRGVTIDNRARMKAVLQLASDKAGWNAPLPEVPGRRPGRGIACNEYHRGTVVANVADLSVGADGDVEVHRIVCAMDCGRAVNPDGVAAQIEGGTIWALSTVLGREITFAGGRTLERTYEEYPVLRLPQAPRVEAHLVPSSLPPFGVGEQPVPAVMPAVLNAIFAATGHRIRRLPLASAEQAGPAGADR